MHSPIKRLIRRFHEVVLDCPQTTGIMTENPGIRLFGPQMKDHHLVRQLLDQSAKDHC